MAWAGLAAGMSGPSPQEVGRLLRDSYGIGEAPLGIVPHGGTSASSFRIALPGRDLFLKRRSPEHSGAEQVRFEHELLAVLQRHGLPVAAPLPDLHGRTAVDFLGGIGELSPWMEGSDFEPGNADQVREAAAALALLHRITADMEGRKAGQDREDDPDRLLRELDVHLGGADLRGAGELLSGVRDALRRLCGLLPAKVYGRLPQAVIHGDFHPGNVKFMRDSSRLAGLFDFDWTNRQERIRDVADGLLFFCRRSHFDPSDIVSLTAAVGLDPALCRVFLSAYEVARPLTGEERGALPLVMEARWLQVRIRGMRKVPSHGRLRFLDRGNLFSEILRIRDFPGGEGR